MPALSENDMSTVSIRHFDTILLEDLQEHGPRDSSNVANLFGTQIEIQTDESPL